MVVSEHTCHMRKGARDAEPAARCEGDASPGPQGRGKRRTGRCEVGSRCAYRSARVDADRLDLARVRGGHHLAYHSVALGRIVARPRCESGVAMLCYVC